MVNIKIGCDWCNKAEYGFTVNWTELVDGKSVGKRGFARFCPSCGRPLNDVAARILAQRNNYFNNQKSTSSSKNKTALGEANKKVTEKEAIGSLENAMKGLMEDKNI